MKQSLQEILSGSTEEKIEAAELIWDSIDEESMPVNEEEMKILKDRYNEYIQKPDDVLDWETAKQKLMSKYGL